MLGCVKQKMAFNLRPLRLIAARMNDVYCDTLSQLFLRRNAAFSSRLAVRLNDIPSPITGARIHQQSNRITINKTNGLMKQLGRKNGGRTHSNCCIRFSCKTIEGIVNSLDWIGMMTMAWPSLSGLHMFPRMLAHLYAMLVTMQVT